VYRVSQNLGTNTVLVTGASGFIGRHTLIHLAKMGFEIIATSREKLVDKDLPQVRWIKADLLDPRSIRELVKEANATHLLHLAWYAEPGKYWSHPSNIDWLSASLDLVRSFAEAGGQRVAFAGTCAEYDWHSGICRETSTLLKPDSLYGASKLSLFKSWQLLQKHFGISGAWCRIFFQYGPYERESRLIPYVTNQLLKGAVANVSAGNLTRNMMHVDDLANALTTILSSSHEGPINVASKRTVTIREVLLRLATIIDRPELVNFGAIQYRDNDVTRLVADTHRLTEELNFQEKWDIDDGLRSVVDWWDNQNKRL